MEGLVERAAWPDKFRSAFDAIAPNLGVVLNAVGCREGWVQGELYRQLVASDPAFRVNSYDLGVRKKADLHGSMPSPMIAELKVYGVEGFYNKNLDGWSNIDIYRAAADGERVDLGRRHLKRVHPAVDSLLRDYQRLSEHRVKGTEKYLILVLHLDGEADTFGRAIRAVRVTKREFTFEYPNVLVRIWAV